MRKGQEKHNSVQLQKGCSVIVEQNNHEHSVWRDMLHDEAMKAVLV